MPTHYKPGENPPSDRDIQLYQCGKKACQGIWGIPKSPAQASRWEWYCPHCGQHMSEKEQK